MEINQFGKGSSFLKKKIVPYILISLTICLLLTIYYTESPLKLIAFPIRLITLPFTIILIAVWIQYFNDKKK